MIEQDNTYWNEIMGKLLANEANQNEQMQLAEWLERSEANRAQFDAYRKIWGEEIKDLDLSKIDQKAEWHKLERKIRPSSAKRIQFRKLSVAAAIFALLMLSITIYRMSTAMTENLITSSYSAEMTYPISLPDGTKVWLNEGSSVSYLEDFQIRDVALKGEAFFEVRKNPDSPFEVKALESVTRVLGTRFNLRVDSALGQVHLFVEEGKVAFGIPTQLNETKILTAGKGAKVNVSTKRLESLEAATFNEISWKTDRLVFDHQPMREVIADLNRHFDIELKVKNEGVLDCTLKSDFNNPTLEEVLETIRFSLNAEIGQSETEVDSYLIDANPCNPKQQ